MTENIVAGNAVSTGEPEGEQYIEPSFLNALPHYLPLGIFPLLLLALLYGGWWLLAPFLFMSVAGFLDRVFGIDGLNMNPRGLSERRFIWYNIPVWTWAFLWPPTLIFGLWQILVSNPFAIWEDVILAILLTMEAQAVFVVGHELVHRRSTWERRVGEFLLASSSYPQYATEHVYIHHAKVGTPHDVGSAPKGESFWRYFPKEVVNNLTNSWQVSGERLARSKHSRWHYSNPFWRYAIALAFWYGLVFYMGGIWAVPVYIFLGFGCVFSMKISNYFQHYGLRRVLLSNGRWEKISPRHSWNADWKFTNWMFFKMQRHADHHAMATRPYPQLQSRADESPDLPGTYGDMMNLVLRPKKWFAKMDPLVDQWRARFYPEIADWNPYDSQISVVRPDDFDAIVEIFGVAPRLAKWIERNPELLDNLSDREFTDLDLPKGIMDDEEYDIARRGLARLYWTFEMGVQEMRDLIEEIPATNAKETAEFARNWTNDRAFQIGMHLVRDNLSPSESATALSNLAEASITAVVAATIADFVEQVEVNQEDGVALIFLGDLASREAYPGLDVELLFVYEGWTPSESKRLLRNLRETLAHLTAGSLMFSSFARGADSFSALQLSDLVDQYKSTSLGETPVLTRARSVYEFGPSSVGSRFDQTRREILAEYKADESLLWSLLEPINQPSNAATSSFVRMRRRVNEIERAARFLQLKQNGQGLEDSVSTAARVFQHCGADKLGEAAKFWRDLQGVVHLVQERDIDLGDTQPSVQAFIANACGHEDYNGLSAAMAEIEAITATEIDSVLKRA